MTNRKKISGKAFVTDLRAGLTDAQLMEKYGLQPKDLEALFKQLLNAGIMKQTELAGRTVLHDYEPPARPDRILPREGIDFPLAVYDAKTKAKGLITDLTVDGIGIKGITADQGEIKIFFVPAREFFGAGRVVFEAKCRWLKKNRKEGTILSGFQIIKIIEGSMEGLMRCIEALSYAERAVLRYKKTKMSMV